MPDPVWKIPGAPQKGLMGLCVLHVDGVADDPGCSPDLCIPLETRKGRMNVDAQCIRSIELNDAKCDLVGGIWDEESNLSVWVEQG